jgi:hypothetical protein
VTKESQALLASLTAQRNHVIGALEGLAEEDLQRPVLPSQWTCAGLVHHLTVEVERFWFRVNSSTAASGPSSPGRRNRREVSCAVVSICGGGVRNPSRDRQHGLHGNDEYQPRPSSDLMRGDNHAGHD